jgi:hypothetical protein
LEAFFASFSSIFLQFEKDFKLLILIQHNVIAIINLDDLNVWFETCEQQIALFQFVMPMVMENLTITQH